MRITKEIIERYHQGACSLKEQQIVEQWLESDELEMSFPENADLVAMEDKSWKKISNRYDIVVPGAATTSSLKRSNYRIFWQLAACVILLLGVTTYYYVNNNEAGDKGMPVYKVVKTLKGQKLSITLADGTVVWLNSESSLRFPESFKGSLRELEFSGEAYFSVAKDPSKPFIIHTAKTKVQVLGTRFNLRALATETATSVAVEEGKVRFTDSSGKQQLTLTTNKRGIFETLFSTGPVMNAEDIYAGKYSAWKNNELLLDNLTMEEAARTLERWYNVKIKISRSDLLKERYTGNFSNPALKQVLESMGFAVRFSYRQQGQTFILY